MLPAFTILLIIWYITLIIYDDFMATQVEFAERMARSHVGVTPAEQKLLAMRALSCIWVHFVMFATTVFELIYSGFVIRHDQFLIPTLLFIAWNIYCVVRGLYGYKKHRDKLGNGTKESHEELLRIAINARDRKATRRLWIKIIHVLYFAYILGMIIF